MCTYCSVLTTRLFLRFSLFNADGALITGLVLATTAGFITRGNAVHAAAWESPVHDTWFIYILHYARAYPVSQIIYRESRLGPVN